MKDLAVIFLHQILFLMHPKLKPTTLGLQDRGTDHQATTAQHQK